MTPSGDDNVLEVRTVNVKRFSTLRVPELYSTLRIDGHDLSLGFPSRDLTLFFEQDISSYDWRVRMRNMIRVCKHFVQFGLDVDDTSGAAAIGSVTTTIFSVWQGSNYFRPPIFLWAR